MRTTSDRVRHALLFEILGVILITPIGALLFGLSFEHMGVIGVGSATVAMVWNYIYNLWFDRAMQHLTGGTQKSVTVRVLHAIGFEGGLLALLIPLIALYLGIGLWEALVMDIAIAGFYVVYAFVFNLGYDRVFPLPEWQEQSEGAR